MTHQFHTQNREALAAKLPAGSLTLVYSGKPPLKTGDEYWTCSTTRSVVSQVLQFLALWAVKLRFQVEVVRNLKVIEQLYSLFFAERNFVYLTGIEEQSLVLLFQKEESGECTETLFLQQPDKLKERWNGARIKADAASELSGIRNIKLRSEFDGMFKKLADSGRYRKLCLDLEKYTNDRPDDEAYKTAKFARKVFPWLGINSIRPVMKSLRLIKKPCEIEAMRRAETVTRNGIIAMMRASKPGLYEYRYKAEWDYALAQDGVLYSGYPPIISAGKNNFCIHYYAYKGQAVDGDMILNDVGAVWDNEIVDVSRGWPCNGRFNDKQKLLYTCAYNTSNYMFGVIKPGMPMNEVDATARRYNFEQLRDAGVCKNFDDAGRYIWHGGAHHIGYDVHDVVSTIDEPEMPIRPGMTFCVDVGIYHEEWGIGFRLEDNCLVTETGCENLSAAIPRGIDEIEAVMK